MYRAFHRADVLLGGRDHPHRARPSKVTLFVWLVTALVT
jgi:hypothetical protein